MKINIIARFLAIGAITIASSGCATTDGSQPTISRSEFHGSRVVNISPHAAACEGLSMICLGIGAQWDSGANDVVIVKIAIFNDIKAITGAALNVDGVIYDLKPLPGLTGFSGARDLYKESEKGFSAPIDLIRKAASGKRVFLKVSTPSGYMEDVVFDGARDSKAYHAMRRFLATVDQVGG